MKKAKITTAVLLLTTLLLFAGCAEKSVLPSSSSSAEESSSSAQTPASYPLAQAYYIGALHFVDKYAAYFEGAEYISFDLTAFEENEGNALKTLLTAVAYSKNAEPLFLARDELAAQGYIVADAFEKGTLVTFSPQQSDEKSVITYIGAWRSPSFSVRASYTVEKSGRAWSIAKEAEVAAD